MKRVLLVLVLLAAASPALAGPAADERAPVTVQASQRERFLVWIALKDRKFGADDQRALERVWEALDLDGAKTSFAACLRKMPDAGKCEEALPEKLAPHQVARDDAKAAAKWLREEMTGAMVRALGRLTRELEAK